MTPRNLWGELPESTEQKPPITILKEQAEMLSRITGGVLHGNVSMESESRTFVLTLSVVAPALDYSYEILQAEHKIELYPVSVQAGQRRIVNGRVEKPTVVECQTEEEFERALAEIFSSPRVKSVIASLRSQSKAI